MPEIISEPFFIISTACDRTEAVADIKIAGNINLFNLLSAYRFDSI